MNKVYIGNISFKANEEDLREVFTQFGQITDVFLPRDKATKKLRGFGFITFESADAMKQALDMDGKDIKGRPVKVNVAKEKE